VTIAGQDFTGASGVSFGGKPARSVTVNSDNSITAVSPSAPRGTVDITVSTVAGQSLATAADRFTFIAPATRVACFVPQLKGKKLNAAGEALKKAHCRLGHVAPKGQTTGRVKQQSRKPGTILPAGTKINITLG
jgi:beta-lactam-binding protein with PASTA domain